MNRPLIHLTFLMLCGFIAIFVGMIFLSPPGVGALCGSVLTVLLFLLYDHVMKGKLGAKAEAIIIIAVCLCIMTATFSLGGFAGWLFTEKNDSARLGYAISIMIPLLLLAFLLFNRVKPQPSLMALITVLFIFLVSLITTDSQASVSVIILCLISVAVLCLPFFLKRRELPVLPKIIVMEAFAFSPFFMFSPTLAGILLFTSNSLFLIKSIKTTRHRANAIALFCLSIGPIVFLDQNLLDYWPKALSATLIIVVTLMICAYTVRRFRDIPVIDFTLLMLASLIIGVGILPDSIMKESPHVMTVRGVIVLLALAAMIINSIVRLRHWRSVATNQISIGSWALFRLYYRWAGFIFISCGLIMFHITIIKATCNKEGPTKIVAGLMMGNTTPMSESLFLRLAMKDEYLWQDKVNLFSPRLDDPEELLYGMRYKRYDKGFSHILSSKEDKDRRSNGKKYSGLGVMTRGNFIAFVFSDSPADKAGLKRGFEILKINGHTLEEIQRLKLWDKIYVERKAGKPICFTVRDMNGLQRDVLVKKGTYRQETPYGRIIEQNGKRIGYLMITSFYNSIYKTNYYLKHFHKAGITELVLDLRYNGGGDPEEAKNLASIIAGRATTGKVLIRYVYNDRYPERNKEVLFENTKLALNLKRLFVLTSDETASASELIINGLRPYISVITVGETTYGKPVGQDGIYYGDKILYVTSYHVRNSRNQGDYFGGIPPTCKAKDDLTHPLGDVKEGMLKAALCYLETERCCKK